MSKIMIIGAALMCSIAFTTVDATAQGRGNGHKGGKEMKHYKSYHKNQQKVAKRHNKKQKHYNRYAMHRHGPPAWAPAHGYRMKNHVYFPDYYTFYDPRRNGYVYWNNNAWAFSPSLPAFLVNVDLGRARVATMVDVPLTRNPERYYDRYYRSHPPAGNININIPIPLGR